MTHFIKNGNTFRPANEASLDIHKQLPPHNFIIKTDPFGNFYFEEIDSFALSGKVYGDVGKTSDRILNTFQSRPASTGVMLSGEKGSGKTLLAKMTCAKAAELGIPSIVINHPWHGDAFNKLLQDITQPCVILFDEFEKVYDRDQQESILTLLDGVFPSRKLFILTCNDKWRVDHHMRNRPGRIFYMLDFKGLDPNFILEYARDNLKNQEHAESIVRISGIFDQFNFDMLKALIEEMNRYDETPQEALKMLNVKPEFSDAVTYDIQAFANNMPIDESKLGSKTYRGNPLMTGFAIDWYENKVNEDEDEEWINVNFSPSDLKKVDSNDGRLIFSNEQGTVILTKQKTKSFDYYGAF